MSAPDAFALDILRAARPHGLLQFKSGWATSFAARRWPGTKIIQMQRDGLLEIEGVEDGRLAIVTLRGLQAIRDDDAHEAIARQAIAALDSEMRRWGI